jgi:hypothetical protein
LNGEENLKAILNRTDNNIKATNIVTYIIMSLPFLLRAATTYEQRYALVKATYDILPEFGELKNLKDFMVGSKDKAIYDEVKEMLQKFAEHQITSDIIHPATLTPNKAVKPAPTPAPLQVVAVKQPLKFKPSATPAVVASIYSTVTPFTKAEDLPPLNDELRAVIKNELNMNVKYVESNAYVKAKLYDLCQGCDAGKIKNWITGNCVKMNGSLGKKLIHEVWAKNGNVGN